MQKREPMTTKETWHRFVFPISKCTGKILYKAFSPEVLFNKVTIDEVKNAFSILEEKTSKFKYATRYFKIKSLILGTGMILFLLGIIALFITRRKGYGIFLIICSITEVLVLIFCLSYFHRQKFKSEARKIYEILSEINQKFFSKKNLNLMLDPEFNSFSLYIVPTYVSLALKLNNFFTNEKDNNKSKNTLPVKKNEDQLNTSQNTEKETTKEPLKDYYSVRTLFPLINNRIVRKPKV